MGLPPLEFEHDRLGRRVRVEVVAPFVTQIDVWHRALRVKLRDGERGIVLLTKVA